MIMHRRSLLLATGILAAPSLARAQDFPAQPICVVVPYAPGG
jgi:tripartite-type tricarboxylate transporter receptor subunit TctC